MIDLLTFDSIHRVKHAFNLHILGWKRTTLPHRIRLVTLWPNKEKNVLPVWDLY